MSWSRYCNDPHTNGHCLDATEKWYPNASPWYALRYAAQPLLGRLRPTSHSAAAFLPTPNFIQRSRLRWLGVYCDPQLHVHGTIRAAGVALLFTSCPRFGAPLEQSIATPERILL